MPSELRPNDLPSPAATSVDAPDVTSTAPDPDGIGPAERFAASAESTPYRTWLLSVVALTVVLQVVLVSTSPPIAPDGITFLNIARALAGYPTRVEELQPGAVPFIDGTGRLVYPFPSPVPLDAVDVLRRTDQHPGYPALVIVGRFLVLPLVPAASVNSWIWGARLVSGIFGVLAVLAVWRLASRLFDRRTALVAAALIAVLPLFRRNAADALSDSPHLVLYLVAVMFAVEAVLRRQARWFALTGAASGLAFWVRPEGLSVAVAVAAMLPLWAWRTKKLRPRSVVKFAALTLLVAALVAGPYVLLSGRLSGKFLYLLPSSSPQAAAESAPTASAAAVSAGPVLAAAGSPAWVPVRLRPLHKFVGEAGQGLMWVLVLPLAVGMFVRDPQHQRKAGHQLVLWLVVVHMLLCLWLYSAKNYMDERHVMVIVAMALPRTAAGILLMARWASRRFFADALQADRRSAWIAAGLLAVAGSVALWRTLAPVHADDAPLAKAGQELKAVVALESAARRPAGGRSGGDDWILSNSPYVAFYAQLPGHVISERELASPAFTLTAVRSPFRFVVIDVRGDPSIESRLGEIENRYLPYNPASFREKQVRMFLLRAVSLTPDVPPSPPEP